jgi:hypothetical protein
MRRRNKVPFVVRPRSSRKLSVFACEIFERSRSRAKNAMAAQAAMRHSILLSTFWEALATIDQGLPSPRPMSSARLDRSGECSRMLEGVGSVLLVLGCRTRRAGWRLRADQAWGGDARGRREIGAAARREVGGLQGWPDLFCWLRNYCVLMK